MSDVPPPPPVTPPPDAGAATTGGEAAANPTIEAATPAVKDAQLPQVELSEADADLDIEAGEATQNPTANEIPDISEAQWVEVDTPASDSQEDMLESAFRRPDEDDDPYTPGQIAFGIASVVGSEAASALPFVMKGLLMDQVDPAGSLNATGLEDAIQVNVLRDSVGAWIRGNAPELAQKLDRIFGKNW